MMARPPARGLSVRKKPTTALFSYTTLRIMECWRRQCEGIECQRRSGTGQLQAAGACCENWVPLSSSASPSVKWSCRAARNATPSMPSLLTPWHPAQVPPAPGSARDGNKLHCWSMQAMGFKVVTDTQSAQARWAGRPVPNPSIPRASSSPTHRLGGDGAFGIGRQLRAALNLDVVIHPLVRRCKIV